MKTKLLLCAMALITACTLMGCETIITNVENTQTLDGQACKIQVIAGTSVGVNVQVTDGDACEKPTTETETENAEVQQSD